ADSAVDRLELPGRDEPLDGRARQLVRRPPRKRLAQRGYGYLFPNRLARMHLVHGAEHDRFCLRPRARTEYAAPRAHAFAPDPLERGRDLRRSETGDEGKPRVRHAVHAGELERTGER